MKVLIKSLVFLCLSQNLMGQVFTVQESNASQTSFHHHLNNLETETIQLNGEDFLNFKTVFKHTIEKLGEPALPKFSTSLLIPEKGVVSIEVIYGAYKEMLNVSVLPSKGNLKRNIDPSKIAYSFNNVYSSDAFYPGKLAEIHNPFILRNERGINVTVYPYQYNPVTKTLRIYENIELKLVYDKTKIGENEINEKSNDKSIFNAFFLNGNAAKYNIQEEIGDYLIICPDSLFEIMKPFVDWKNQKGIKTKLVGTNEIGNSAESIKNYIAGEYTSNPALLYLLLVGDHAEIPAYIYGNSGGEDIISDTYYGQLAGNDFYPELFVGRFSGTTQQIGTMVERVLEYEKNPLSGNWMTNAIGIGSSEGAGIGDDNEEDWTHIRNIKTQLETFGYNQVYEFYDGTRGDQDEAGDPTSAIILPALNSGVGLLNYTGHGDINEMVTGGFTSFNVNNATNNGKYPFVISVACNNGTFIYGTCISETWLRARKNGSPSGAIAACGSSILMSWAPPMQTQDEMTAIITESYQNNRKTTLGGLFYNAQLSMLENYPGLDGDEVMQTWVFFGDPSVEFRNKITQDLVVNHVPQITQNETQLSVSCNEELTNIAISQNNVFLTKGIISAGNINFTLPTLTSNLPLVVTATKQNFKPYQGNIQVGNGPLEIDENDFELFALFPNPTNNAVQVNITTKSSTVLTLFDLTGKEIKRIQLKNGYSEEIIDLSSLASGIYQLKIESQNNDKRIKIIKN